MKAPRLIRQSLLHYWRGHLGVLLGGALGTAVLVGALIVGDSVRGSLREQAYARLARITHAVIGNDRFVRDDLARLTAAKREDAEKLGLTRRLHHGPFRPRRLEDDRQSQVGKDDDAGSRDDEQVRRKAVAAAQERAVVG